MTMTFEWFIVAELCVLLIVFMFDMASKRRIKTQKSPERHFDGRIVINTKDPNKDVFRLEYDGNVADITTKEYVTFQVVREDL